MILPFTDRFKPKHVLIFAVAVFLIQQIERTNLTFSILTAGFIIISAAAYNAGGGLSFPSGAYIFFNATLTAIFGLTYKLFLGERGESHMLAPNVTMSAYCVGMMGMGLAAALSHRLRPKKPLLPSLDIGTMRYAAIGCLLVGGAVQFLTARAPAASGTIWSALHQLNYLPRMALIFATIYQMSISGGKSSTNWIVWTSGGLMFFYGLIAFSKEGLFVSVVTWLMTAILYRFNFTWRQLAVCFVFVAVGQFILVPFSQYGRRSRVDATSQSTGAVLAFSYLKDPLGTRALYLASLEDADYEGAPHLYNSSQGLIDRLNMVSFDDAIIAYTDQGHVYGLLPVYATYLNVVPRVFWKDKPDLAFGNDYAHELGVLSYEDTTTGISFGPIGDAYHEATWFGVIAVFPVVIFLFFFLTDSLTGSVRDSPYALLPIAIVSHAAPEGMLSAAIYLQTYGIMLLIVVGVLSKHLLARFTRLAMGGDRVRVERTRDFVMKDLIPSGRGEASNR